MKTESCLDQRPALMCPRFALLYSAAPANQAKRFFSQFPFHFLLETAFSGVNGPCAQLDWCRVRS